MNAVPTDSDFRTLDEGGNLRDGSLYIVFLDTSGTEIRTMIFWFLFRLTTPPLEAADQPSRG